MSAFLPSTAAFCTRAQLPTNQVGPVVDDCLVVETDEQFPKMELMWARWNWRTNYNPSAGIRRTYNI